MKVEFLDSFVAALDDQVAFIARDKPAAARKFKNKLLEELASLPEQPYRFKRSPVFTDPNIREMTFKGYRIFYKVDLEKQRVSVFALLKHQNKL